MIKNFTVKDNKFKMYYDNSTRELRVLLLREDKTYRIAAGIKDRRVRKFIYHFYDDDKELIGQGSSATYYQSAAFEVAKSLARTHPIYGVYDE